MKIFEEMIKEGISCLIPVYEDEKGNCTKIITDEGRTYVDGRILKTVLKAVCQYYTVQIEYCRKKYGELLHQKIGIPILLHRGLLLIPIKMRKPLFSKDGAYGYINYFAIQSVTEEDGGTMVLLNNDHKIKCLQKIRSVHQYITKAKVIIASEQALFNSLNEENFLQQYNAPATRGDIASLKREIREKLMGLNDKR